eukprot:m.221057 g.221057  ORF g.221057 m.221057 type:complete len:60 (-) comp15606_c0_seq6:1332-1511(-)
MLWERSRPACRYRTMKLSAALQIVVTTNRTHGLAIDSRQKLRPNSAGSCGAIVMAISSS